MYGTIVRESSESKTPHEGVVYARMEFPGSRYHIQIVVSAATGFRHASPELGNHVRQYRFKHHFPVFMENMNKLCTSTCDQFIIGDYW